MMLYSFPVLIVTLSALSFLGTRSFLLYATRKNMFDVPNERSSHVDPVPRGGGIVFSILALLGLGVWSLVAPGEKPLPLAVLLSSVAVLALGFVDDQLSLSAKFRLLCQIVLAATVVLSLEGPMASPTLFGLQVENGTVMSVCLLVGVVWLVNLYNFMDGVDALAAGEALFVALSGAAACWLRQDVDVAAWLLILAACLSGFLVWNLPPAKVFMGDAGSVFLGFFFGTIALQSHVRGGPELTVWLILLGVFCVDATVTLVRRMYFRQSPFEAHRTHAYQYSSRRLASHGRVSLGVAVINVSWLAPLAFLATLFPEYGLILLAVAYIPLIALAVRLGAGVPETHVNADLA